MAQKERGNNLHAVLNFHFSESLLANPGWWTCGTFHLLIVPMCATVSPRARFRGRSTGNQSTGGQQQLTDQTWSCCAADVSAVSRKWRVAFVARSFRGSQDGEDVYVRVLGCNALKTEAISSSEILIKLLQRISQTINISAFCSALLFCSANGVFSNLTVHTKYIHTYTHTYIHTHTQTRAPTVISRRH
jgi:hypothetical protein